MRRALAGLLAMVALLALAYGFGWWPEHQRAGVLEAERAQLQQRADAAEGRVRAGALLGDLLALRETVQDLNYGQARGLSTPFFEKARAEAARATDPALKAALESLHPLRDPVTVALTQGDAAALTHLREAERRLRVALGYPPPPPTAAPLPAPTALPPGPAVAPVMPGFAPATAPPASPAPASPAPASPTP
jgi:hypothetical protein